MAILTAVSSSARQLYQLLRCINFSPKTTVQISSEGIRFSVEDARAAQGLAFLDRNLFTSYVYHAPSQESNTVASQSSSSHSQPQDDDEDTSPTFQISLSALLEILSIFGTSDFKDRPSKDNTYSSGISNNTYSIGGGSLNYNSAFDSRTLGISGGLCRIAYVNQGSPLRIALEESGVKTTCSLTTYSLLSSSYATSDASPDTDIPFDRDSLALKIITRASHLHDAITELSSLAPSTLQMTAIPPPTSHFRLSATGALGSASVDFTADPQLLETFQCRERCRNTYSFHLIKHALRAMSIASKVSIRGDAQGVLSLQFMIEVETGGVSFVDFRFVPFIEEDDEDDDEQDEEENATHSHHPYEVDHEDTTPDDL